jgi:hypothetical protein
MIFGQPKQIPDGRYYLKVTSEEGSKVLIQMNNVTMVTPFASSDTITLTLKNSDTITSIDNEVVEAAKTNSTSWFGKEVQAKTLEAAYSRSVDSNNTMNVSKATANGKVNTTAFDHTKTQIDPNTLDENTTCDILLEFSGVWFMKKTFGPIWRIVQVRLKKPVKVVTYMFKDEEEVDGDDEENDSDYV